MMEPEDDNFERQKQSAEDETKDKYKEHTDGFNAKDQGLGNGVVKERGCKDILCLMVFAAFIAAMVFCTIYGNKHGQLAKLMAPLDGDDRFCGFETITDAGKVDLKAYPKLYITDLKLSTPKAIFQNGVCVDKCPKKGDKMKMSATKEVQGTEREAQYNTKEVIGYCFPTGDLPEEFKAGWKAAKDAFLQNPIGSYFNDLYLSSNAIFISFGMSVVYSFVFIYLMSAFAEPIAWICVVLAQLAFIGGAVAGWFWRVELVKTHDMNIKLWTDEKAQNLIDANKTMQTYAMLAIVGFAIASCLFATCIFCGFKSLKLAIDVIDASADFLARTKRIILVPVLYFFVSVIIFIVWIYAFLSVASMN